MDAKTFLEKVISIVSDRGKDHGPASENFRDIANIWSTYLGMDISPKDVAGMMILFKLVRATYNPKHMDNWFDIAGYTACAAELVTKDLG